MLVSVDRTTMIQLTLNRKELKELLDSISSLVTEKIDLKKYTPLFAIKDAITEHDSDDTQ